MRIPDMTGADRSAELDPLSPVSGNLDKLLSYRAILELNQDYQLLYVGGCQSLVGYVGWGCIAHLHVDLGCLLP